MIENGSPIPCVEVQALLSEYLDQQLTQPLKAQLQRHLEGCHLCLEHYVGLRTVQGKLHQWEASPDCPSIPSLWERLEGQLRTDQQQAIACQFDEMVVSAYWDAELTHLPAEDRVGFEPHLFQCPPCNELLGDFTEISRLYQEYTHRLEAACEIDLTQAVMAQIKQEKLATGLFDESSAVAQLEALSGPCAVFEVDEISGYIDQALTPKETLDVSKHIEACMPCRDYVHDATQFSIAYQDLRQRWETLVPGFWPILQPRLENILSFRPKPVKQRISTWWYGSTAVAAVALLLFQSPGSLKTPVALLPSPTQQPAPIPVAQQPVQKIALVKEKPVHHLLIASTDKALTGPFTPKVVGISKPLHQGMHDHETIAAASPSLPQADQQAVVAVPGSMPVAYSPSAEEYLMRANRQEIPNEEVRAILGNGNDF